MCMQKIKKQQDYMILCVMYTREDKRGTKRILARYTQRSHDYSEVHTPRSRQRETILGKRVSVNFTFITLKRVDIDRERAS